MTYRIIITWIITEYTRTASGKSWSKTPVNQSEAREITREQYDSLTNDRAAYFWGHWGGRASCRRAWSYTCAGYRVTRMTRVSPDGQTKYVDTYDLEYVEEPRQRVTAD